MSSFLVGLYYYIYFLCSVIPTLFAPQEFAFSEFELKPEKKNEIKRLKCHFIFLHF